MIHVKSGAAAPLFFLLNKCIALNTSDGFAIILKEPRVVYWGSEKEVQQMNTIKTIKINGHVLEKALLVDDPDVKKVYEDSMGNKRHIRSFSQADSLKRYIKKHPEGMILAGVGVFFFDEPVPVSSAMVRFDEAGNANILIREGAAEIEEKLESIDTFRSISQDVFFG